MHLDGHLTCRDCDQRINSDTYTCPYLKKEYKFSYPMDAYQSGYYICKNFLRRFKLDTPFDGNDAQAVLDYYKAWGELEYKNPRPIENIYVAFQAAEYDRDTHKKFEDFEPMKYYMRLKDFVDLNWYDDNGKLNWEFRGWEVKVKAECIKNGEKSYKLLSTMHYENRDGKEVDPAGIPLV